MSDVAFLVAESPWYAPIQNPGQASSFPFIEGIGKLMDVRSYYATFFGVESFEESVAHLTNAGESCQILYVGGHGDGLSVGDTDIEDICDAVSNRGKKIKGMIVSSCHGAKDDAIKEACEFGIDDNLNFVSGPNWIFTYKNSADWVVSTLMEQSILACATQKYKIDRASLHSTANIIAMFAKALRPFSPWTKFNNDGNTIAESVAIYCRPQGTEHARDITKQILDRLEWEF
jgi:hypothetical protein